MKKICLALVLLLFATQAWAQSDVGPDPTKVRIRMGPLWLNPSIAVTNLGVDNNVFNEETDPKKDFTFTVSPRTEIWLRGGRTWVHGTIVEDLIWYQEYETERAGNGSYSANWLVPLNRLTLDVGALRLNARQRADVEIDARVHRTETSYSGSASFRVLAKTSLGVNFAQQHTTFADDAVFREVSLREELSRTLTVTGVSVSHRLTPLTNISVQVAREAVEFDFTPDRDTNSNIVVAKVSFDPLALLRGNASFGYRQFKPVATDVPGYNGMTAALDLSYTAFGATKLTGKYIRDVQFSYDASTPYYLQNGFMLDVIQQVFGPVDVAARAGTTTVAYRDRGGAPTAVSQPDRTNVYGGGVGYHLGQDIRIGVNADQQKRTSPTVGHGYEGLRLWMAVSYGL